MKNFRKYLLTGLIIWVPLGITLWAATLVIDTTNDILAALTTWLPPAWHFNFPGRGLLFCLLLVGLTGLFASNYVGEKIMEIADKVLSRIPVVGSIYSSVKQVSDTILSDSGNAFRKAVLIQYPSKGSWTIAFQTGTAPAMLIEQLDQEKFISVYVTTTPNPTSGFLLLVKEADIVELDISVDAALKYVISMGVAAPVDPKNLPIELTKPQ
jgi:uncharacterized membrane protein